MKIKVEKKDLIIFIAFCVFLLYLCAIGVLNASSIATEGKFYGFLPFKAFTPRYIGMTFFLFLAALIGIFMAVKSYIFDRDKGFGITIGGKKEKGYSRWATDREFKNGLVEVNIKDEKIDAAGIALHSKKGKMWVDNGEDHYLVMGATGSGKTVIVAKPMIKLLAKHNESMILTDPKGELYEETAELLKAEGYNIITLNFRDPQHGNAWNPMSLPYQLYKEGNTDKAIELLDDLALNILYEEKNSGDPFWEKTAADYFTGLALGLFEDGTPEQVNLNSLNLMCSLGEERFGGPNNNYIKEYFNGKDPSKPAYINASGTVFTADETKQGIIATFKQKIKLFSSRENLSEMLSYSDFDMRNIGRNKTAVFLIVQDEKKTLHPLATIFIKQCYETLIDVAQESGGKLPFRTNFILDEFANMPPLKDVTTMVTAARSRLIRFTFIIQNFAQLTQVYGKENGDTIRGNCNLVYLISSEIAALEEISKMCGEVKSKEKEKMEAMGGNPFPGATGATPFGTPNPFMGMSNPFSGGLPPFMSANDSSEDSDTSFNIDDLVKKIDAKIAEIEKEEEQTKEVEEKKNSPFEELVSNKTNQVVDVPSEEVHKEVPTAPAVEQTPTNVEQTPTNVEQTPVKTETISNMYQDNTNDDDFFDDFFSDD